MRLLTLAALLLFAPAHQEITRPILPKPAAPAPAAAATVVSTAPPIAPITFEDADGQALIFEELTARTAIHGMLSLTELELRFRNPQARVIEGRFTATLPVNASISRLAKEVNGHLMEGEVVERLRANQVYEQFLHRMRDPALLEQDQGNRFSARVFPIGPNEPVRLIISYTQLLPMRDGVRSYTLPLRGMPKVGKLSFRGIVTPIPGERTTGAISTSTAEVSTFDERDWTPDRDVTMSWRSNDTGTRVLRAGDFYVASIRANVAAPSVARGSSDWLFYVDTSASAAEGAEHRIRAVESLLAALPGGDRVELVAFDNEVVPLGSGTAREQARNIGERLRKRLFIGGTDLAAMLRDLRNRAGARTVVVASDLVPTLGATGSNDIQNAASAIPATARVHALILGSREDAPVARVLTAGRGRIVRIPFTETLTTRAAEAVSELQRPLGGSVDVRDAGAEWLYPTHFDDVAAGDELLVLGKVRPGDDVRIAAGATTLRLDSAFAPLLQREAYRAYLQYLAEREASETADAVRRALATEQVKISIEQRVVIPRTTMLVLESEWDYQRFGLDRRALADILTVDAAGIARVDRTAAGVPGRVVTMPVTLEREAVAVAPKAVQPRERAEEADFAFEAPVPPPVTQAATEAITVSGAAVAFYETEGIVETSPAPQRIDDSPQASTEMPLRRRREPTPAPPPPPAPVPPPVEKKRDAQWTKVTKPSRSRIAELEEKLRAEPRDRELYNQLGETLAALEEWSALRSLAVRWQPFDPENPQVYELLGLSADMRGDDTEAARAFASLIEIAPAKTELLQRAGLLLLRARRGELAETPLRKALEARPDRANGYRHLALMLWQSGRVEEAARVLESATRQNFPDWYRDVQRVIREELGYVYRAWMKKEPGRRNEIAERAREHRVDLERRDALRVTLVWETDANDVDLHIVDPDGEECFYQNRDTRSGLFLYEDLTQGLGPEVIRTPKTEPGTYHVGVRYFAAGPMGISRGLVVVLNGDDNIEVHPFRLAQGGGDIRYVAGVRVKG
jgi:tetratricopeptide (TPR) repeat protein